MSEKQTFYLVHDQARRRAAHAIETAGHGYKVTVQEAARTLDQNAAQWPILDAFSRQLKWPVNGEMVYMTDEEWKDVLTAAFRNEKTRVAMGLDGGVVMLGQRTSKFGKGEFSDWLEFLHATAAYRGVVVYADETPKVAEPA